MLVNLRHQTSDYQMMVHTYVITGILRIQNVGGTKRRIKVIFPAFSGIPTTRRFLSPSSLDFSHSGAAAGAVGLGAGAGAAGLAGQSGQSGVVA